MGEHRPGFFGAPVTHEDDPIRAVYAAQAIRTEIQAHSKEIEAVFGVPMRLHMVLNTGPVLIGEIKSNLKYTFQSLGRFGMYGCSYLSGHSPMRDYPL